MAKKIVNTLKLFFKVNVSDGFMLRENKEGIIINLKISPQANRSEICGWENDNLKVRLAAIPEKGKANQALITFFAKHLKIPKSQVLILRGETCRIKQLLIKGKTIEEISFLLPDIVL